MHLFSHDTDQIIKTILEFLRCKSSQPEDCFQLLCLISWVDGAISLENYNLIKKELVERWGLGILCQIEPLIQSGMIKVTNTLLEKMTKVSHFKTICKKLKLVDADIFEKNPERKIFPYFGYSSVFANILDLLVLGEFKNPQLINKLPGKFIHHGNPEKFMKNISNFNGKKIRSSPNKKNFNSEARLIIVIMGGVTYSELAEIRLKAKNLGIQVLFVVSRIINYKSYLNELTKN